MIFNAADSASQSGERACTLTALVVADIVGGDLRGDPAATVSAVAPLGRAGASDVSFFADRRYADAFAASQAGIVLVTPELADAAGLTKARIIVAKPQTALLELLPRLYPSVSHVPAVHSTSIIGRGVRIGAGVSLGAYSVVGDGAVIGDRAAIGSHCSIGDGVVIGESSRAFPSVTLYPGTVIGKRVILHSGVRIGSDGFGYVFAEGAHARIPHVGRCVVGDDVEIGANTTIDRGSIDDTVIGSGTKIDNLVQIGHNVKIGQFCLIMAQVGIAGSAQIGDGCVLAGQAGLGGHIVIGDGARIGGQSGVFGNVPAGETWSGYPARPHRESLRATGALFKIARMMKNIEKLVGDSAKEP